MRRHVMFKRSFTLLLLLALFCWTAFPPGTVSAATPQGKEEVVYATLSPEGSLEEVYVVNSYADLQGTVIDYGSYDTVTALSGQGDLSYQDGKTTIKNGDGPFYYQGELADPVLPWLYGEDGIFHTLIISPPRCGKTTLLRDLVRQISNGNREHRGCTVGVVDERSEICGCFMGIPGNDVGIRTDVMDACPKAEGMMMLIRSMAPEVIAVDEIGRYEDIPAIETVLCSGCRLIATVHGSGLADLKSRPLFQRLLAEQVFERYVILGQDFQKGRVRGILDGRGKRLC